MDEDHSKQQAENVKMGETLLRQAFDLWINPELAKRRAEGRLVEGFELLAAQVVMNVGRRMQIRVNEEVKAVLKVKVTRSVERGEPLRQGDFDEIHGIELTQHDPDAGHLTLIRHNGSWIIGFDFEYNSRRIWQHIEASKEFLETAHESLEKKRWRSFYENLFCATELTAKAWLLKMPLEPLLTTSRHTYIQMQINAHSKLGNIESKYAQLYNYLRSARDKARYLNIPLEASAEECLRHYQTASEMIREIEATSPAPKVSVEDFDKV